jgi:hypothetical protein
MNQTECKNEGHLKSPNPNDQTYICPCCNEVIFNMSYKIPYKGLDVGMFPYYMYDYGVSKSHGMVHSIISTTA